MNRTETNWPPAVAASPDDATAALHACMSPASFWAPEQIGPQVPWLEHAPFASWLVEASRPRTLVELGTHGGFSYFAFCETVQRCGLDTRCFAVDTWTGDEHAGFYGEEIFQEVANYNERRYSAFSTLVRSTFDDAVRHFSDSTIDLLHIDGRHFYADVKHDFETWRPKLSERALIMFHDTNLRERGFGVFRLWEDLRQIYPHFEFLHGNGLGVLGIGAQLPAPVRDLFGAAADPRATAHIRNAYARLGLAVCLSEARNREAEARTRVATLEVQLAQQAGKAVHRDAELTRVRAQATQLERALKTSRQEFQSVMASTSWRLTRPIRQLGLALPRVTKFWRRVLNMLPRDTGVTAMEQADSAARAPAEGARGNSGEYDLTHSDSDANVAGDVQPSFRDV